MCACHQHLQAVHIRLHILYTYMHIDVCVHVYMFVYILVSFKLLTQNLLSYMYFSSENDNSRNSVRNVCSP